MAQPTPVAATFSIEDSEGFEDVELLTARENYLQEERQHGWWKRVGQRLPGWMRRGPKAQQAQHAFQPLEQEESIGAGGGTKGASPLPPGVKRPTGRWCPEENASVLSRMLFLYVGGLVRMGYYKTLDQEDLWDVASQDEAKAVSETFMWHLRSTIDASKAPQGVIWRAMWRTHGRDFFISGGIKMVHDVVMFAGPVLLELLLKHVQSGGSPWVGLGLASALAGAAVVETLTVNWYFHMLYRMSLHLKVGLVDALFRKSLRVSGAARSEAGVGKIVNLQSNDAAKLWNLPQYMHMVWSGPFQILVVMALLVRVIHWLPALAALAVTVTFIPTSAWLARCLAAVRKDLVKLTDARVKLSTEVITGIKAIKLYAWEGPYVGRISALREQELAFIRRSSLLSTFNSLVFSAAPVVISLAAFLAYALLGYPLTAAVAFPALSLFNLLRFPVAMFPQQISNIINGKVALGRIQAFMEAEEMEQAPLLPKAVPPLPAVEISSGSFAWHQGAALEAALLRDINLQVRAGELVIVVGSVGAGKSSLLAAMLGEMVAVQGSVVVRGQVALTQQDPWIQNASLRENILLGAPLDLERYSAVLDACALLPDLEMLPAGDETEIGEKGVNLSGGQRHRVALARACFAQGDVYLLDDPLSAVDAHVGRHLFDKCICGLLHGHTRVLVTHQLQYLAAADTVVVVRDGRIAEQGTYRDLQARGVDFHQFEVQSDEEGEGQEGPASGEVGAAQHAGSPDVATAAAAAADAAADESSMLSLAFASGVAPVGPLYTLDEEEEEEGDLAASLQNLGGAEDPSDDPPIGFGGSGLLGGSNLESSVDSARVATAVAAAATAASAVAAAAAPAVAAAAAPAGAAAEAPSSAANGGLELAGTAANDAVEAAASVANGGVVAPGTPHTPTAGQSLRHRDDYKFSPKPPLPTAKTQLRDLLPPPPSQPKGGAAPGGRLTAAEERAVGRVDRTVYKAYFAAWSRFFLLPLAFLALAVIERGLLALQNWWLSIWSNATAGASAAAAAAGTPHGVDTAFYLGVYFACGLTALVLQSGRAVLLVLGTVNAARSLQSDLLQKVVRLPQSFFDSQPTGRLLNRLTKDTEAVDTAIGSSVMSFLNCAVSVLWSLVVVVAVSPLIVLAIVPLALAYAWVQARYICSSREIKRLDSLAMSPIFGHFSETLHGLVTVRAFRQQRAFESRNSQLLDESSRAWWPAQCINRWLSVRLELLGISVVFGTAAFVAVLMPRNAGLAGLALTSALNLTGLLNWFVRMTTELEVNMNSVERMVEYLSYDSEAPAIIPERRPLPSWPSEGAINAQDLVVRYRPDLDPVLKGISFSIRGREKVGVVGRTGCGKSTLMLALYRLVEPVGGRILIDGIDTGTIGLYDLRSRLALVPQDPVVFSGTIRSNLDPFGDAGGDEAIWGALKQAGLRDAVRALQGALDAKVSEGGANLSVGQRQLLCMARALLRRARVLILDEATSNVDTATDALIQATIASAFADCTVLTIAHRLHTIMGSDRILVLAEGRVREFDTPGALLRTPGSAFRALVEETARQGGRQGEQEQ